MLRVEPDAPIIARMFSRTGLDSACGSVTDLAWGDVDNDGDLDLIVSTSSTETDNPQPQSPLSER